MQLTLMRNRDAEYIANKTSVTLFTGDIEPYGSVTNAGAAFVLDGNYPANYARYVFGDYTIYGTVEISCHADGLYQYNVSVDPLTTMWYAGAFNSTQYVVRETAGNTRLYDSELTYSPNTTTANYTINDLSTVTYYAVTVIVPGPTSGTVYPDIVGTRLHSPATQTYILNQAGYIHLLQQLRLADDAKQARFAPCISRINAIDENDLPTYLPNVNSDLVLHSVNQSDDLFSDPRYSGDDYWTINMTNEIAQGLNVTCKIIPPSTIDAVGVTKTVGVSLPTGSYHINDTIFIDIRDGGSFSVTPGDLPVTGNITTIGYNKTIDWSGGVALYKLVVNNTVYHNYKIVTPLPETLPLNFDNSITNWTMVFGQMISNTIGSVTAAATGNIPGTASGIMNTELGLLDAVLGAKNGGSGYVGALGSSTSHATANPTRVVVIRRSPVNEAAYQSKFGMPSETTRNLSTRTGYIRTRDCKFGTDYPRSIVTAAEQACDAGFRIKT